MNLNDYRKSREALHVVPEVAYACDELQRHGDILFVNFSMDNAIDKAAEMLCIFLDEDEDWIEFRRILRSREIHGDWT